MFFSTNGWALRNRMVFTRTGLPKGSLFIAPEKRFMGDSFPTGVLALMLVSRENRMAPGLDPFFCGEDVSHHG